MFAIRCADGSDVSSDGRREGKGNFKMFSLSIRGDGATIHCMRRTVGRGTSMGKELEIGLREKPIRGPNAVASGVQRRGLGWTYKFGSCQSVEGLKTLRLLHSQGGE